jgi:hypothetical protein
MAATIFFFIFCVVSFIRFMENHKYVSIYVLLDMLSKHTFLIVFSKKCFLRLTLINRLFFLQKNWSATKRATKSIKSFQFFNNY